MKIIIAGGRDFNDYNALCKYCDHILSKQKDIEIISGGAYGADKLGERYAVEHRKVPFKRFPAEWDKHGKSAGYIRNTEMAEYSDALIAFWDNKSKGTKHMIDIARNKKLKVRVYKY